LFVNAKSLVKMIDLWDAWEDASDSLPASAGPAASLLLLGLLLLVLWWQQRRGTITRSDYTFRCSVLIIAWMESRLGVIYGGGSPPPGELLSPEETLAYLATATAIYVACLLSMGPNGAASNNAVTPGETSDGGAGKCVVYPMSDAGERVSGSTRARARCLRS
jgi:hypothetical protein